MHQAPPSRETPGEHTPGRPHAEERKRFLGSLAVAALVNVGWLAIAPDDQRMYGLLFLSAVAGMVLLLSVDTDSVGFGILSGSALAGLLYLAAIAFL